MRSIAIIFAVLLTACSSPVAAPGKSPAVAVKSDNPAAKNKPLRQISPWKDTTFGIIVPTSSDLDSARAKTVEMPAKLATFEIFPGRDYNAEFVAVYDPTANITSVVLAQLSGGLYISSPSGLLALGQGPASIKWYTPYIVLTGNQLNVATARFEQESDSDTFFSVIEKSPGVGLDFAGDPYFFRDVESKFGNPVGANIEGCNIVNNVLRIDFINKRQKRASLWIDLKERKVIRSIITGGKATASM